MTKASFIDEVFTSLKDVILRYESILRQILTDSEFERILNKFNKRPRIIIPIDEMEDKNIEDIQDIIP